MNPDSPIHNPAHEALEAHIVSWVLGEASAFEAAELERLCEERPELLVFRRRMRELHGLLTESEAALPDDGWKLPEEKRKVLDEIFGSSQDGPSNRIHDAQKEKRIRHSGRRALLAGMYHLACAHHVFPEDDAVAALPECATGQGQGERGRQRQRERERE